MNSTWRDFRWHLRARFALGLSLDRVHMVDTEGRDCEVVKPRWWDVHRWWQWLTTTDGHIEIVMHDIGGDAVFLRMRSRTISRPLAFRPITLKSGRTLVPGPVTAPSRFVEDRTHRLVSDEYLEKHGITHRE